MAQQNPYSRSTSPSRASCDPVTSACPATFARSGQRLRALPNPFQALCQKTRLFSENRLSPVCAAASSSTAAACGNLDLALDNVGATHLTAWWNHISDRTAATWRHSAFSVHVQRSTFTGSRFRRQGQLLWAPHDIAFIIVHRMVLIAFIVSAWLVCPVLVHRKIP